MGQRLEAMLQGKFVADVPGTDFIALHHLAENSRVREFSDELVRVAKHPERRIQSGVNLHHDFATVSYVSLGCGIEALVTTKRNIGAQNHESSTPIGLTFGFPERDRQLLKMLKQEIALKKTQYAKELAEAWTADRSRQPHAAYVMIDAQGYRSKKLSISLQGGGNHDWPVYVTNGRIRLNNDQLKHYLVIQYRVVLVKSTDAYKTDELRMFAYLADAQKDDSGQERSVGTFVEVKHEFGRGYKPASRVVHHAKEFGLDELNIEDDKQVQSFLKRRDESIDYDIDYGATIRQFGAMIVEANRENAKKLSALCKKDGFLVPQKRGLFGLW